MAADRLNVGGLGVTGAAFTLALQPQRIDLDLTKGQLAGGTVTGGMSVHNVGGNVNFAGRFDLKGAALESFVWRRDGTLGRHRYARPVRQFRIDRALARPGSSRP